MKQLCLAALICGVGHPGYAECATGLDPFLTCEVGTQGKQLNVCFNSDVIVYSFGRSGDPELVLTETVADIDYTPWPGIGRAIYETVQFTNGGYQYTVVAGFDRMFGDETEADHPDPFFGNVQVTHNGETLADLSCRRETAQAPWGGLYDAKLGVGLEWDWHADEWREIE